MIKEKKVIADDKPKVPSYIVTFSDMVTLLLTFFVLLLSMANTQDEAKFMKGQASIKRAIATMGLAGFLPGKDSSAESKFAPIKYSVDMDEEDNNEEDPVDEQFQTLKDTIFQLESLMHVSPSQIIGDSPIFEAIGIDFNKSSSNLSADMKKNLRQYSVDMSRNLSSNRTIIYVIGFCDDFQSMNQNRIISTKRAQVVSDSLKKAIQETPYLSIYYWGAGSGGDWVSGRASLDKNSDVTIAILTAD